MRARRRWRGFFSFLARREDIAPHCQDFLMSENPEPALRELIRAAGDGLEFDLDDVIVLQHIHQRAGISSCRSTSNSLSFANDQRRRASPRRILLPCRRACARTAWALARGEMHAACFDPFEARLEDELRRCVPAADVETQERCRICSRRHGGGTERCDKSTVVPGPPSVDYPLRRLLCLASVALGRTRASTRRQCVRLFCFRHRDQGIVRWPCPNDLVSPTREPGADMDRAIARGNGTCEPVSTVRYLSDTNVFVSYPHRAGRNFGPDATGSSGRPSQRRSPCMGAEGHQSMVEVGL